MQVLSVFVKGRAMNVVGPIIIVIEAIWILVLIIRERSIRKVFDQMTGYLAGILNNDNLIKESLSTIALYYGMEVEDLVKLLERNKNESK